MAEGAPLQITAIRGRSCLRIKGTHPFVADPLAGDNMETSSFRLLSIGPGEWLFVSPNHSPAGLRQQVESQLPTEGFSLVDLTDGLAGFEIQGSTACELLSKGCGLDFHPQSFPVGHYARTRFAQIPVVIECLEGPPRFELIVARSYLRYLQSWLTDAAVEFAT